VRERIRSFAYRARRYLLKAPRRARRAAKKALIEQRRRELQSFKAQFDQTLWGGPEPSWNDIREDARRLLRGTRVTGGEQADYDKAMDRLIKPKRGDFST